MATRRTAASPRSIQDRADFAAAMPSSSVSAGRPGGCPATFAPSRAARSRASPRRAAGVNASRRARNVRTAASSSCVIAETSHSASRRPGAERRRGQRLLAGRAPAAARPARLAHDQRPRGEVAEPLVAARDEDRDDRRDVEQRRALDQPHQVADGARAQADRLAAVHHHAQARSAACPACGRRRAPRRRRGRRPRSASGRRRRPRRSRGRRCRRRSRRPRSARARSSTISAASTISAMKRDARPASTSSSSTPSGVAIRVRSSYCTGVNLERFESQRGADWVRLETLLVRARRRAPRPAAARRGRRARAGRALPRRGGRPRLRAPPLPRRSGRRAARGARDRAGAPRCTARTRRARQRAGVLRARLLARGSPSGRAMIALAWALLLVPAAAGAIWGAGRPGRRGRAGPGGLRRRSRPARGGARLRRRRGQRVRDAGARQQHPGDAGRVRRRARLRPRHGRPRSCSTGCCSASSAGSRSGPATARRSSA